MNTDPFTQGDDQPVVVIGSGPAGLATAAELTRRGVGAVVLEQGAGIGAAWAARYDGLRFNTSRLHSALPGAPFERAWGQFPTRDQYVGYLAAYARSRHVRVRTHARVERLDRRGGTWRVTTPAGILTTRHVVVACGRFNVPVLPDWARRERFGGRLMHAVDYRNAAPLAGQRVLVVGAGSTGMEIAHELVGVAGTVWLSVRTPPTILFRMMLGAPGDLPVPVMMHLPPAWVDRLLRPMQRRVVGNLAPYGLPEASAGPMTRLRDRGGIGVAVVDPPVVDSIRSGAIRVVPAVDSLEGEHARLADGRRLRPDVVIAATGYRTGLEPLVGRFGVLDERGEPVERTGRESAPGLRFVGYVARPGITGYAGRLARRAASEIAARERASRRARRGSTPPASPARSSRGPAASRE
ncbi:SidA/IucD/PvdA family monooxygenase [Pseudactinotalea sp. HY160]|uniref:flavin-containing monooxygenase n=1 Tax=Pseudactinotalea sp. HY160 TaxID=2654490 RepID=UPI00128DB142|nr:NAD(P)/FAD-dependent oxidoreductase [Pseudactinotalea sp. HY160]MPV51160.1 SidA/IucD/PvdA family monooxygenase [Pseudactinotalea sp. HY160]